MTSVKSVLDAEFSQMNEDAKKKKVSSKLSKVKDVKRVHQRHGLKKQRQKLLVSQMLEKQMLLVCMRWQIVLGTVGGELGPSLVEHGETSFLAVMRKDSRLFDLILQV